MKNLSSYKIARIRLARTNAKKLTEERSQTASAEQPSGPLELGKRVSVNTDE